MYQKTPRNGPETPRGGFFGTFCGLCGVFWYILGGGLVFGGSILVHNGGFFDTFLGIIWYLAGGGGFGTFQGFFWYIPEGLSVQLGGFFIPFRGFFFGTTRGGLWYNSGGSKYICGVFSTFCLVSFWDFF